EIRGFGGGSYITFLTPGVIVMTAMYAEGFSGMSIIEDLDRGVVDRFLVTPAHRGAMMAGLVAYQTILAAIQSLIIVGLGLLVGARFPGGVAGVLVVIGGAVVLGAAFASLSNALALLLRTPESVIGIVTFIVLPLSFLSAAFMQLSLIPAWMQDVARVNPINWAVQAGREALGADVDWSYVLVRVACLIALAAVC